MLQASVYLMICLSSSTILYGVISTGYSSQFRLKSGYRVVSGATQINQLTRSGMTIVMCAATCSSDCGHFQVNLERGACVTYIERFYIQSELNGFNLTSDPEWTIGYIVYLLEEGWVLAFRAQKEIDVSLFDTWRNSSLHHDDPVPTGYPQACLRLVDYESCDRHFRSKILDNWVNIKEIRVSWILSDVEVAYTVFNGTDSNWMSWFTQRRILSSTWAPGVINDDFYMNRFKGFVYGRIRRRLYLYSEHIGCRREWFYTLTIDHADDTCLNWDTGSTPLKFPIFLFSETAGRANFGSTDEYPKAGQADVMAFWVKFA